MLWVFFFLQGSWTFVEKTNYLSEQRSFIRLKTSK